MATKTSSLHAQVSKSQQFDEAALLSYAQRHVEGFPVSPSNLKVSQFGHGQSNPTFLLEAAGSDGAVKRYVLRKKPRGVLLESAHAVEREFKVIEALSVYTNVPVPKAFCLCTDPSIIGTSFYIMEYLEGRIYLDQKLPGISPERRKAIYQAIARTLASLHKVNVDSIGLQKFGRRENYCRRQVERWARQYLASTAEGKPDRNPKMLELIDWLKKHIPLEDSLEASSTCLVHGDFRIDNLVFHPIEDKVIGILDWELSTLGNQMCDVAYSSMSDDWAIEGATYEGFESSGTADGIPSLVEYLAEYCSAAGRHWPAADWKFYMVFSMFRGASILAAVYRRWILGNASGGERAKDAVKRSNALIVYAWEYINKASVLPHQPPLVIWQLRRTDTRRTRTRIHMDTSSIIAFLSILECQTRGHVECQTQIQHQFGVFVLLSLIDSAARARKLLFVENSIVPDVAWSSQLLGAGLSNLEYGYLCEIMGRSVWAPQIFNCGAPDTGNMEVLLRYGTKEQLKEWLIPLLEGKIRSGFAMTEPQVASSDATNIECSINRQRNSYVINGKKWWTSGAMDPRCKILIVMGKTDLTAAKHKQQSMILVDVNTPGVNIKRPLLVFGFDDAPHGHAEISFENVRVPVENILLGEGRGFEIAQGRLGPGRLHHCMRLIGAAERGMQLMVERALHRRAFGKLIAEHGSFLSDLAKCRIELERTRLLVLEAADQLDRHGNKKARGILAMAKVAAPNMALRVLDLAMQVHGAAGLSSDTVLSHLWATARTLRIADGPDEVHLGTIAKLELQRAKL